MVIPTEPLANPMVLVHHRGDPIEPEPIDIILLQIPRQVRQQKTQHLPIAVIEDPTVPLAVHSRPAFVEVQMVSPV